MIIAGNTITPGERTTISIPFGTYTSQEPVNLIAHVYRGKKPGPTTLVTAGIHGDEINGIEIIRRLMKEKFLKRLQGTLITIPIINLPAFSNRSRYMPDRRDLNRLFPGAATGSLGARLAHALTTEILPHADLVIDLHTGAVNRANLPQLRVTKGDQTALDLAKIFSPPAILISAQREGSFRYACNQKNIPVLLYESGEALRLDTPSIRFAINGIKSILQSNGNLPPLKKTKKLTDPVTCLRSVWERAPIGGLYTPLVPLGKAVEKGTPLGFVANPYGTEEATILASQDGILIGRTNEGQADQGDALVHIGIPNDYDTAQDRIDESAQFFPDHPEETDDHPVHHDHFHQQTS